MNLKDSINLFKFGQKWGMINTLFKCMFLDKMKNRIFFKFELLEDDNIEILNSIKQENNKINKSQKILNLNTEINSSNNLIKKVLSKGLGMKEKEKYKMQTKYKDRMYEISLLNCSLRNINITSNSSEDKYYIDTRNILNAIFSIDDVNKIDVVDGSFFGIKYDLFKSLGFFDENTFLYYEENILGYKIKKAKHQSYILNYKNPPIHAHKESITSTIKFRKNWKIYNKSRKYYCINYLKINLFKRFILNLCIGISSFESFFISLFK